MTLLCSHCGGRVMYEMHSYDPQLTCILCGKSQDVYTERQVRQAREREAVRNEPRMKPGRPRRLWTPYERQTA